MIRSNDPIKELLRDLLDRGLTFEEDILCVVDGSRGLRKAGDSARPGTPQGHRRGVWPVGRGSTLPVAQARKRDQLPAEGRPEDRRPTRRNGEGSSNGLTRSRPTRRPKNEAAKERLTGLYAELEQINRKADNSLMEGLEETLTLHRLGLFEELGRSLKTTNCIENLNEQVEGYTGSVKRWHHSPQRHRWMALRSWRPSRECADSPATRPFQNSNKH